jgi:teichuronic acid biosynthesis glycosyltransferase TuaG
MHEPFISVVIPSYNAAKYLAETLESVRAQTFRNYEVIVVDDGSTDRTFDIAARFEGVRRLRQANRGAAAARNAGIGAARGAYVAFLDADDLWLPKKLEKQVAYLEQNPKAAWIYSDARVFDSASGRTICRIGARIRLHEGEILRPLLLRSFIPSATPVVRRDALFAAGLFDEARERRIGEDWSLWMRIAERHPIRLIDEPLALIRAYQTSTSRAVDPLEAYRSERAILEQAIARNPVAAAGIVQHALSEISASTGLRCLRRGNLAGAGRLLFEALKLRCYGGAL